MRSSTIQSSKVYNFFPTSPESSYLEVAIFVHISTGEATNVGYGGNITVRVREQEHIHTAASCYTFCGQFTVEVCLLGKDCLKKTKQKNFIIMILKWSLCGDFGEYVSRKTSICKMLIALIEIQQNNFKNYKILDYNTFSSDIPIMFANTHQLHKFSVKVIKFL